jgi:S-(hydroxymethyl)glutathione dehydrogenase/alcohol dehydrogenase
MQAAVLYQYNEPLKVEPVELGEPKEGEVRVRLAASGVCHSDLSLARGLVPMPTPVVIGHEGAGIVDAVGPGVTTVQPGDHVILTWMYPCHRCRECSRGRPAHCQKALVSMASLGGVDGTPRFKSRGTDIHHFVGTFSEYTVVPERGVLPIRTDAPLDKLCLVGCGVMTAVGAVFNTAKVEPGSAVAVFGCGGLGLNVIQAAALCGAERIIAVDLVAKKLKMAQEFGATHTVDGSKGDPVSAVRDLTGGHGVDYAFEVIGAPAVIVQAFHSVCRGGKAIVVGMPPFGAEVTLPAFPIPMEEKSIIGCYYGSPRFGYDMPRIVDLYMAKKLKLDELVSRRLPLKEINTAFELMEKGEVARSIIQYQ